MKFTDEGVKDIKGAPQRIEHSITSFEKMGGKVLGFYVVTGEYDYIAIGECPSDEVFVTFALGVSAGGNIKTTTIQAFLKEEFADIVKRLP